MTEDQKEEALALADSVGATAVRWISYFSLNPGSFYADKYAIAAARCSFRYAAEGLDYLSNGEVSLITQVEPLRRCECEAGTHFGPTDEHRYLQTDAVRELKTVYGTFAICQSCFDKGHMARGGVKP